MSQFVLLIVCFLEKVTVNENDGSGICDKLQGSNVPQHQFKKKEQKYNAWELNPNLNSTKEWYSPIAHWCLIFMLKLLFNEDGIDELLKEMRLNFVKVYTALIGFFICIGTVINIRLTLSCTSLYNCIVLDWFLAFQVI